eukprot:m.137191 g.137191  ORF g.137191 m.137191 type:complete len:128 (+) comp11390_c0_seq1:34-417(+)
MSGRDQLLGSYNDAYETDYVSFEDDSLTFEQRIQLQDKEIAEQDRGLEDITHVTRQLKYTAIRIGDEVDDQNEMLEDLDDGMTFAHAKVVRETAHVEDVMERAKATGLCCTVFLLILAIVLVGAIPF